MSDPKQTPRGEDENKKTSGEDSWEQFKQRRRNRIEGAKYRKEQSEENVEQSKDRLIVPDDAAQLDQELVEALRPESPQEPLPVAQDLPEEELAPDLEEPGEEDLSQESEEERLPQARQEVSEDKKTVTEQLDLPNFSLAADEDVEVVRFDQELSIDDFQDEFRDVLIKEEKEKEEQISPQKKITVLPVVCLVLLVAFLSASLALLMVQLYNLPVPGPVLMFLEMLK